MVKESINTYINTKGDKEEEKGLLGYDVVEPSDFRKEVEIIVLMICVITFGAFNRVSAKIMSEPMNNYSFFLTLFNGVAYVLFYGAILAIRYCLGRVPRSHLQFPFRKAPPSTHYPSWCHSGPFWRVWDNLWALKYFIIIGFLEGLGNILSTIANPYVSGIMGSLATQAMILFAMPCAIFILGTRYTIWQVMAAAVVLTGALVAIIPDFFQGASNNGPIGYILLMTFSNLPNAISFTIKELIFKKEKGLELFVVNTAGSTFQLLWWPLMVPITLLLDQTNGLPLWTYVRYGFMCFIGQTPTEAHAKCSVMPTPYLIYITINLLYNICLLMLLKRASALLGFMAVKAVLPVSVFLFLVSWPLIGPSSLDVETSVSLVIILIGLTLYRWATYQKEKVDLLE